MPNCLMQIQTFYKKHAIVLEKIKTCQSIPVTSSGDLSVNTSQTRVSNAQGVSLFDWNFSRLSSDLYPGLTLTDNKLMQRETTHN